MKWLIALGLVGAGVSSAGVSGAEATAAYSPGYSGPNTADPPPAPGSAVYAKREASQDEGLFDPVRIGAFGGVGFPRPLSIEGFVKIEKIIGFGLEYSLLPKLTVSGVDTQFWAVAGDVRVFPLQNGFFIGMAAGRQHLGASTTIALPAPFGSLPEQVTGDTWFINPRIGFLSTWSWGMTVGIDAGVQIPVAASFTNTLPSGLGASQDATNVAHLFGKNVLPTVDLLRLGLLL